MMRRREHLIALARAAAASLARVTGPKRARLERVAGRIAPHVLGVRLARAAERTKALEERATRGLANSLARRRGRLDGAAQLLASLGYRSVLRRGFALVRTASGSGVRSVVQARPGDKLDIELADGRITAAAETLAPSTSPGRSATAAPSEAVQRKAGARAEPASRARGGNGNQGSLF
jgi:exodeoxyribonuclease VII large subunit